MLKKIPALLCSGLLLLAGATAFGQPVQTLIRTVNSVEDDAEQCIPGGTGVFGKMNLGSSDLDICTDGTQKLMMGMRFKNLPIPSQAIIQSAYIQFTTKGDSNPIAGDVYITVQDSDSTAAFVDTLYNMSGRPMVADSTLWPTNASPTWSGAAGGTAGPDQKTTNFASVLQKVINRPGWNGSSLVVTMKGEGTKSAWTYNGSPLYAPKLIIQYEGYPTPMPVTNFPVRKASSWKYLDDGSDMGTAWTAPTFNDSSWSYGPGKLGYNDNAAAIISYGPNPANRYITYYFRKQFNIPSLAALDDTLVVSLLRDDGAIVFINGAEVLRSNMPSGAVNYRTKALTDVNGTDESAYTSYYVPRNLFVNGLNTIAVEVHQKDSLSDDLGFDLELKERALPALIRGPYLQMATQTSMNIRWRTDEPVAGQVHYGTSIGALTQVAADPALLTEHEIKLTGLTPYTKYYYAIGTSYGAPLQGDTANYFYTLPPAGNSDNLYRIGVIGDCGNNSTNQRSVRDKLSAYLGNNYMNAWILLGDNAYNTGTDAEYQAEFFNIYKDQFLKQNPLFPAPGNHDYGNSQSSPSVGNHILAPYYQNFTMPTHGESGGLASNSEAFYSFDIGNVHFLSLDSYGKEDGATTRLYDTTGAQVQWIKQDLQANSNKGWTVVYWHHPPYTMGSHNSDAETELVNIRQNFIRILERYGVDLILCGHSHDYERSKLMKGHYGAEASFDPATHNLSQSTGLYNGSLNSCPYIKDSSNNYQGTVYVVSGSAGQLEGEQPNYPHDALPFANSTVGGSMILEVKGNRLDAKWICSDGTIRDKFTMMKDVNKKVVAPITHGASINLEASFNSDYTWQGVNSNSKSVTVSPVDTTVYTVKDSNTCLADTFVVQVSSAPLPLSWGYIKASRYDERSNLVSWETLQEKNVQVFEVERSENGASFFPVGTVAATGNSMTPVAYTFLDKTIAISKPVYYYRIHQKDIDGKSSYSATVQVSGTNNTAATTEVIVAPNPAHAGQMQISISGSGSVTANMVLTDLSGSVITKKTCQLTNKGQLFLPQINSGIYLLSVITEGNSSVRKIVIP
ncbi:metallophosphoesterase [Taibaiella chishuiensis]|uniref:Putative secreted protein (Por secretion system target) n=1 Tax=Taibaiella chishuiensis TaxID=1434707 RepID=A0A2P8D2Z2_9BACT|nr:metallophosphoesterase [Taibaiella chishuiensis]PSK91600.1 putative secreted protein (Por secretion system target) [Taibaiella chishuiensis]